MIVIRQKVIFRADVQANVGKAVYLFGDNLTGKGYGGQAKQMRGEPNAIGIPTKKKPSMTDDAFFSDDDMKANNRAIDQAFASIPGDIQVVIIPFDGIGTGLAKLEARAPLTFQHLNGKMDALINSGGE